MSSYREAVEMTLNQGEKWIDSGRVEEVTSP